jgi:hypothetical protein
VLWLGSYLGLLGSAEKCSQVATDEQSKLRKSLVVVQAPGGVLESDL